MVWQSWHTYFLIVFGLDVAAVFVWVYLRDRRRKTRRMITSGEYLQGLAEREAELREKLQKLCRRQAAMNREIALLGLKEGQRLELGRKLAERSALFNEICALRLRLARHKKYVAKVHIEFSRGQVRRGTDATIH